MKTFLNCGRRDNPLAACVAMRTNLVVYSRQSPELGFAQSPCKEFAPDACVD
jgi:hypothetical protein